MGNDMFNEEQLADAAVRVDAAVLKDSLTTDAPSLAEAVREAEEALETAHMAMSWHDTLGSLFRCRDALRALLAAVRAQPPAMPSLDALAREVHEWAERTFPGTNEHSKSEHLRREAQELADAPTDPEEMADVFILLANLSGYVGVNLAEAVAAKFAKNKARTWGKPDAHGVIEHIREQPPAPAPFYHVTFLTGLPVELNPLLPEGSIFMHPRTFRGLPPERQSWLDRMRADAAREMEAKAPGALDGDGRDGYNGGGPFEG